MKINIYKIYSIVQIINFSIGLFLLVFLKMTGLPFWQGLIVFFVLYALPMIIHFSTKNKIAKNLAFFLVLFFWGLFLKSYFTPDLSVDFDT